MTRNEMVLRYGFYAGLAARILGDMSYFERFHGRAETMTEDDYAQTTTEIAERLILGGYIRPDEDPFESQR